METGRVESNGQSLVLKNLRDNVEGAGCVVPDADGLILGAGHHELLTDADIHASYGLRVEVADHVVKLGLIFRYIE